MLSPHAASLEVVYARMVSADRHSRSRALCPWVSAAVVREACRLGIGDDDDGVVRPPHKRRRRTPRHHQAVHAEQHMCYGCEERHHYITAADVDEWMEPRVHWVLYAEANRQAAFLAAVHAVITTLDFVDAYGSRPVLAGPIGLLGSPSSPPCEALLPWDYLQRMLCANLVARALATADSNHGAGAVGEHHYQHIMGRAWPLPTAALVSAAHAMKIHYRIKRAEHALEGRVPPLMRQHCVMGGLYRPLVGHLEAWCEQVRRGCTALWAALRRLDLGGVWAQTPIRGVCRRIAQYAGLPEVRHYTRELLGADPAGPVWVSPNDPPTPAEADPPTRAERALHPNAQCRAQANAAAIAARLWGRRWH